MISVGRTKDFSIESILARRFTENVNEVKCDDRLQWGVLNSCTSVDEKCTAGIKDNNEGPPNLREINKEEDAEIIKKEEKCRKVRQGVSRKFDENPAEKQPKSLINGEISKLGGNKNEVTQKNQSMHNEVTQGTNIISPRLRKTDSNDQDKNEKTLSTAERALETLTWLRYTRYEPPKISRRPSIDANKRRKPSLHPRIPFSTFQLDYLEKRFQRNAYLSKNDVMEISRALALPSSRVKIWFQNRRARDRRDNNNKT